MKYFVLSPTHDRECWFVATRDANGGVVVIAEFWASRYAQAACDAFNEKKL